MMYAPRLDNQTQLIRWQARHPALMVHFPGNKEVLQMYLSWLELTQSMSVAPTEYKAEYKAEAEWQGATYKGLWPAQVCADEGKEHAVLIFDICMPMALTHLSHDHFWRPVCGDPSDKVSVYPSEVTCEACRKTL